MGNFTIHSSLFTIHYFFCQQSLAKDVESGSGYPHLAHLCVDNNRRMQRKPEPGGFRSQRQFPQVSVCGKGAQRLNHAQSRTHDTRFAGTNGRILCNQIDTLYDIHFELSRELLSDLGPLYNACARSRGINEIEEVRQFAELSACGRGQFWQIVLRGGWDIERDEFVLPDGVQVGGAGGVEVAQVSFGGTVEDVVNPVFRQ